MFFGSQTHFADAVRTTGTAAIGALVSLMFATLPALGQTVGDTIVVQGETLKAAPNFDAEQKGYVEDGTKGVVTAGGPQDEYFRIDLGQRKGWVSGGSVVSVKLARKVERAKEEGYGVVLVRQTFGRNSADGISVGVGLLNISKNKTIKYAEIDWKLFNSVGDPAAGENSGEATAETKLVGPIEPKDGGYTEFENLWYSPAGSCAEVREIMVEYIDGSTSTLDSGWFSFTDDLQYIATENARLTEDCSYEAQQERKN